MLFSVRRKLTEKIIKICEKENIPLNAFNIITILAQLNFLDETKIREEDGK
jgi:hypothetical protein